MQSLQARINSFQKAKRVKRYPKKSSSSAVSVKWPHPESFKANPNTLAEAGFFFSPSWDDRDSVTCFLCGKELSDWDENDDPFEIHYTKCHGSCAWALVRCGLTEDVDSEGCFVFNNKTRLPSSKAMEKARLETFGKDWWPHDKEQGHGAASLKMARAGFVYTPQAAGDDTVTCLYCNLSLGGWEKHDDPVQEHSCRDGKSGTTCPFLLSSSKQMVQSNTDAPAPARAKRGKTRSTTSSLSKSRRNTRATRGKSFRAPAATSQRSPSPAGQADSEQDRTVTLDAFVAVDVPDQAQPPLNSKTSSSDAPASTPRSPGALSRLDPLDAGPNCLDENVPLIPVGPPAITGSNLLTHHDRALTLEQWIRKEIDISCEKLLIDGRRQIDLFKAQAAELRKCIDDL